MPKSKLPADLGQALQQSESAVPEPIQKPTKAATKPKEKRAASKKKSAAAIKAAQIAEERYGITKPKPKTAAERQRHLREQFVPISVMLEPGQKAKLDAVVAASERDGLTDFIRNWIDEQPEPGEQ